VVELPEALRGVIVKLGSNEKARATANGRRRGVMGKGLEWVVWPGILRMSLEKGQMKKGIRRSVQGLVDRQVS
jgi:hypothetical protein